MPAAIATDAAGAYVTGFTPSPDFATAAVYERPARADLDAS